MIMGISNSGGVTCTKEVELGCYLLERLDSGVGWGVTTENEGQ